MILRFMSRDDVFERMKSLHLANNMKIDVEGRFYKVRPLFDMLNDIFEICDLSEYLTFYETIVPILWTSGFEKMFKRKINQIWMQAMDSCFFRWIFVSCRTLQWILNIVASYWCRLRTWYCTRSDGYSAWSSTWNYKVMNNLFNSFLLCSIYLKKLYCRNWNNKTKSVGKCSISKVF